MSDSQAAKSHAHESVHRRSVLGGVLVATVAGLLGRWRRRAHAAPGAQTRPPGKRRPVIWIGHM